MASMFKFKNPFGNTLRRSRISQSENVAEPAEEESTSRISQSGNVAEPSDEDATSQNSQREDVAAEERETARLPRSITVETDDGRRNSGWLDSSLQPQLEPLGEDPFGHQVRLSLEEFVSPLPLPSAIAYDRTGDEEDEATDEDDEEESIHEEEEDAALRMRRSMIMEVEQLEIKHRESIERIREELHRESIEREEDYERKNRELVADNEELQVAKHKLHEELLEATHRLEILEKELSDLMGENEDLRRSIHDVHNQLEEHMSQTHDLQVKNEKLSSGSLAEKLMSVTHKVMRRSAEDRLEEEKKTAHEEKGKFQELESSRNKLREERDYFEKQWQTLRDDCELLETEKGALIEEAKKHKTESTELKLELEALQFQADRDAVMRRERRKSKALGIEGPAPGPDSDSSLTDGSEVRESANLADELAALDERVSIGRRRSTQALRIEADLEAAHQTISQLRAELAHLEQFRDNQQPALREMTERVHRLEREKQQMEADVAASHTMAERIGSMESTHNHKEAEAERAHHAELSKITKLLKSKEQESAATAERLEKALRDKDRLSQRLAMTREAEKAEQGKEYEKGMEEEQAECASLAERLECADKEVARSSAEAGMKSEAASAAADREGVQLLEKKCAQLQRHLGRLMDAECQACTLAFEESRTNEELQARCQQYLKAERSAQELYAEAQCEQLYNQSTTLLRAENAALELVQEGLRQTDWLEAACARVEQQAEVALEVESRVQGAARDTWENNEAFRQHCETMHSEVASEKEQLEYTRLWLHDQAGHLHTHVTKFVSSQNLMHGALPRQFAVSQLSNPSSPPKRDGTE